MISPRNKNPVFIIAPLRSGSTLLHLMLDSHPAISNPGEFDFMFDQVTDEGKVPVMDDYLKWLASDRIFLAKGLLIDRRLSYEELLWSWAEKLRGRKKVFYVECAPQLSTCSVSFS